MYTSVSSRDDFQWNIKHVRPHKGRVCFKMTTFTFRLRGSWHFCWDKVTLQRTYKVVGLAGLFKLQSIHPPRAKKIFTCTHLSRVYHLWRWKRSISVKVMITGFQPNGSIKTDNTKKEKIEKEKEKERGWRAARRWKLLECHNWKFLGVLQISYCLGNRWMFSHGWKPQFHSTEQHKHLSRLEKNKTFESLARLKILHRYDVPVTSVIVERHHQWRHYRH